MQIQDKVIGFDRLNLPELVNANNEIPSKKSDFFRISTWNVHEWSGPSSKGARDNKKEISDTLMYIDSDAFCVQEAIGSTPKDLSNSYQVASCKADRGSFDNLKNEIFVKNSIKIKHQESFDIGGSRCLVLVVLKMFDDDIIIANVHFDVRSSEMRQENIDKTLKLLDKASVKYGTNKIVLCGDFNSYRKKDFLENCDTDEKCLQLKEIKSKLPQKMNIFEVTDRLEEEGWIETFTQKSKLLNISHTDLLKFIPANTNFYGGRIDFIYLSPDFDSKFEVKGTYVYFSDLSDHTMIIADFKRKEKLVIDSIKKERFAKIFYGDPKLSYLYDRQDAVKQIYNLLPINQYNKTWTYLEDSNDKRVLNVRDVKGDYKASGFYPINQYIGYNSIGDIDQPKDALKKFYDIRKKINHSCSQYFLESKLKRDQRMLKLFQKYNVSDNDFGFKMSYFLLKLLKGKYKFTKFNQTEQKVLQDYLNVEKLRENKIPVSELVNFLTSLRQILDEYTAKCKDIPELFLDDEYLEYFEDILGDEFNERLIHRCKAKLLENIIKENDRIILLMKKHNVLESRSMVLFLFLILNDLTILNGNVIDDYWFDMTFKNHKEVLKEYLDEQDDNLNSFIKKMKLQINQNLQKCLSNPSRFDIKSSNEHSDNSFIDSNVFRPFNLLIFNKFIISLPTYYKELVVYRDLFRASPKVVEFYMSSLQNVGDIVPIFHFLSTATIPVPYASVKSNVINKKKLFFKIIIPPNFPFMFLDNLDSLYGESEVVLPYTLDKTGQTLTHGLKLLKHVTKKQAYVVSLLDDTGIGEQFVRYVPCDNPNHLNIVSPGLNGPIRICVEHYYTLTIAPLDKPIRVNNIPVMNNPIPPRPNDIFENSLKFFHKQSIKTKEDFDALAEYLDVNVDYDDVDNMIEEYKIKHYI